MNLPDAAQPPEPTGRQISRRGLLVGILNLLSVTVSCTSRPVRSGISPPPAEPPLNSGPRDKASRELRADLARLSQRSYSEEGVAVFLVGENLTRTQAIEPERAENTALRASFRHHAEVLARLRHEAKQDDVAKLMEVLAERQFGMLGAIEPQ